MITSVSRFAAAEKLGLLEVLESEVSLAKYASTLSVELTVGALHALVKHLLQLGYEKTGIRIAGSRTIQSLAQLRSQLKYQKQHPVIPPRIFSALISELSVLVGEVDSVSRKLCKFTRRCSNDRSYGRGLKNPPVNRYAASRSQRSSFLVGAADHGLLALFERYDVGSVLELSGFIARVQHGCKFLLHIYSGMRDGEAHSLKVNCLRKIPQKDGTVLRLVGTTTKLAGTTLKSAWVTSPEVERPILLLKQLAKMVIDRTGADPKSTPLFVSMAYLGLTRADIWERGLKPGETCKSAHFGVTPREVVNILETKDFRISSEDLRFLESVDAHRAWGNEPKFKKGSVWRFTTHQFRRSLAYYAAQSGLVSLPTLKRQFKHITREMAIYYSNGSGLGEMFSGDGHFSQLLDATRPDAGALAYVCDVLLSTEPLSGGHGLIVERSGVRKKARKTILRDRETILRRFRNGDIAYSETALGSCTSPEPCDKKLTRQITACLSCDRSVITPKSLDRVINSQSLFVKELQASSPKSVELRSEKAELSLLKKYRRKLVAKERSV